MSKDSKQQITNILAAVEAQGWRWELRKAGHYVIFPIDKTKPQIVMPATPSDHRSIPNTISLLRRAGLIYPWPPKKGA